MGWFALSFCINFKFSQIWAPVKIRFGGSGDLCPQPPQPFTNLESGFGRSSFRKLKLNIKYNQTDPTWIAVFLKSGNRSNRLKEEICFNLVWNYGSAAFIWPLSSFFSLQIPKSSSSSSPEVLGSAFERWLNLCNEENKFTLFRGQLPLLRSLWCKNTRRILRIEGEKKLNRCLQADGQLSLFVPRRLSGSFWSLKTHKWNKN